MRKRITLQTVRWELNTPYLISKNMSDKEIRAEYTALRDIIQKRIKRITKNPIYRGYDRRKTDFYRQWKSGVPKIRDLKGKQSIYILAAMKGYVKNKKNTARGYDEYVSEKIKELHKAGYTKINNSNFQDFVDYMEKYRSEKLDHIRGSVEVAEAFITLKNKNIDMDDFFENFELYMSNIESIKKLKKPLKTGKLEEVKARLTKNKKWKKVK